METCTRKTKSRLAAPNSVRVARKKMCRGGGGNVAGALLDLLSKSCRIGETLRNMTAAGLRPS